jgi:hypothetical protein
MNVNFFRLFGLVVLAPVLSLLLYVLVSDPKLLLMLGPRWLVLLGAVVMVGFGLCFLRKWAALYFSVPLFWFGIQEAFVAIYQEPFPGNLLVMAHGLSLTMPLVVTILIWKQHTWGRRFF